MKQVRGIRLTLKDIIESNPLNTMFSDYVTPAKATVLSFHMGTVVESAEGGLYLVPQGDWFRSDYYLKGLPQITDFNQLQDLGFTEIKDKVVRNEESHGQEVRSEDNVSAEKADEAVAPDTAEEEDS